MCAAPGSDFVVDGTRVHGIPSFYEELSRVLMPNEAWALGPSLDALDDLLSGGIGALVGVARPTIVLRDHAHLRDALGVAATRAYYLEKIARPDVFHVERFERQLAELDASGGPTYFDTVVAVFGDHENVTLRLE